MSKSKPKQSKEENFLELTPLSISQFKQDIMRYRENQASIEFMGKYVNIGCDYDQFHILSNDAINLFVFLNWGIKNPSIAIREENIKKVFYSTHYYQLELKNGDMLHITFLENEFTEIGTSGKLVLKQ